MEDLGAAVERIMADPAFSRMVKELGGGDGGDLMEKLPKVMETLGPMLGGGNGGEAVPSSPGSSGTRAAPAESSGTAEPGAEPGAESGAESGAGPAMPADGILSKAGSRPYNRSDAEKLFLALKPYLGERRRELADRCVSLMQMGELMKAAGLLSRHGAGGGRESHET